MSAFRLARGAFKLGARGLPASRAAAFGGRRAASSTTEKVADAAKQGSSSETAWIIGSVAVFGPTLFYMTSPSSKKEHAHHEKPKKPNPPSVEPKEAASDDDSPASGPSGEVGEGRPADIGDNLLRERISKDESESEGGPDRKPTSKAPAEFRTDKAHFDEAIESSQTESKARDPKQALASADSKKEEKSAEADAEKEEKEDKEDKEDKE